MSITSQDDVMSRLNVYATRFALTRSGTFQTQYPNAPFSRVSVLCHHCKLASVRYRT
jgi:hypothetical protein